MVNISNKSLQNELSPKNIHVPANINVNSTPLEYFNLFWDDALWQLLVTEMNHNAACITAAKPNYCAKNFVDLTVAEIKDFFGCRVTMELLIHKERYEQYWRAHDNLLTETPGFSKVMTWDRFLAIMVNAG